MKILWAMVADAANSTENGKINLLGAFRIIYAESLPIQYPSICLVAQFQGEPNEIGNMFSVIVRLVDPDGGELIVAPQGMIRQTIAAGGVVPVGQTNLIAQINLLPFLTFGPHFLEIEAIMDGRFDSVKNKIEIDVVPTVFPRL